MTEPSRTAAYYDRLSRWTRVARWVGYGGGYADLTVHRALADPAAGGRATTRRLHDLLADTLPPVESPRGLDAGCGMGGTMIDLATRRGGRWVGLTLSETQARVGRQAASRLALADRVELVVRDYHDPPAGPFDVIIAVESLAHAADPAAAVRGLAARLAPGGAMAIVDDMPTSPSGARGDADLASFKAGWECPVLFTAGEYHATFDDCGLRLLVDRDLTTSVAPRPAWRIRLLEWLNRGAHVCLPLPGWRQVLASHRGGLALERLYRRDRMSYRLLVAQRPSSETVRCDRAG